MTLVKTGKGHYEETQIDTFIAKIIKVITILLTRMEIKNIIGAEEEHWFVKRTRL